VALSVDYVTLLPMYYYQGATPYRVLCEPIPVAGTGAGATLLSVGAPAFVSNSPVSYASDGSSDNITSPSSFSATFSGAVGTPNSDNFVIHSYFRGKRKSGVPFTGTGTSTINSPSTYFKAGELVEITLTQGTGICKPRVYRYRIGVGLPSGTFTFDANYNVN